MKKKLPYLLQLLTPYSPSIDSHTIYDSNIDYSQTVLVSTILYHTIQHNNRMTKIETSDSLEIQKTQERPVEINPASFNYRDLLLLTQILHTRGLLEPDQVRDSPNLDEYGELWFNHKSTTLSRWQEQFPLEKAATGDQVLLLYENMLIDYAPCKNTTELANCFYHLRLKDLESKIAEEKANFEFLHKMA